MDGVINHFKIVQWETIINKRLCDTVYEGEETKFASSGFKMTDCRSAFWSLV